MAANSVTITISAYSEEAAIKTALSRFKKVEKIEKLKAGFEPNKTKVINKKMEKKKWVSRFYLYSFESKAVGPGGEEIYVGMRTVDMMAPEATKADAVNRAKELVVETQKPISIRLVRVLESGSNVVSDVLPNGGILGKYNITGIPNTSGQLKVDEPAFTDTTEEVEEEVG